MILKKAFFLCLSISLLKLNPVLGQMTIFEQNKKIYVIDDHGNGVKSEIFKLDRKSKRTRIGLTDDIGYKEAYMLCEHGDQIEACPKSGNFFHEEVECTKSVVQKIKVTRKRIYVNLKANAAFFEKEGEFAKAAMIYSDISARAASFDAGFAEFAETNTHVLFGKYLGMSNAVVYDPKQRKEVMSPIMKEKVKEFQRGCNIKESGKLDYSTLSTAADAPIGNYMFKRFDEKM